MNAIDSTDITRMISEIDYCKNFLENRLNAAEGYVRSVLTIKNNYIPYEGEIIVDEMAYDNVKYLVKTMNDTLINLKYIERNIGEIEKDENGNFFIAQEGELIVFEETGKLVIKYMLKLYEYHTLDINCGDYIELFYDDNIFDFDFDNEKNRWHKGQVDYTNISEGYYFLDIINDIKIPLHNVPYIIARKQISKNYK